MKALDFAKKIGQNAVALNTMRVKNKSARDFDSKISAIKTARAYDNAPNKNDDGSISNAGKARIMGQAAKDSYLRSIRK